MRLGDGVFTQLSSASWISPCSLPSAWGSCQRRVWNSFKTEILASYRQDFPPQICTGHLPFKCQNLSKHVKMKKQTARKAWNLNTLNTFPVLINILRGAWTSYSECIDIGQLKGRAPMAAGFSQGTTIVLLNEAALRELNRFSGAICQVTEHDKR